MTDPRVHPDYDHIPAILKALHTPQPQFVGNKVSAEKRARKLAEWFKLQCENVDKLDEVVSRRKFHKRMIYDEVLMDTLIKLFDSDDGDAKDIVMSDHRGNQPKIYAGMILGKLLRTDVCVEVVINRYPELIRIAIGHVLAAGTNIDEWKKVSE